jgi:hypothetical protein
MDLVRTLVNKHNDVKPMVPNPKKKGKYMSIQDYIDERIAEVDEEQYLRALLHLVWEILMRQRAIEEDYGDRGLPVHHFAKYSAKIINTGVKVAEELRKRRDSEFWRNQILVSVFETLQDVGVKLNPDQLRAAAERLKAAMLGLIEEIPIKPTSESKPKQENRYHPPTPPEGDAALSLGDAGLSLIEKTVRELQTEAAARKVQ